MGKLLIDSVQKTIDTLHKEGDTKVHCKEAGCSQSSLSKHINRGEGVKDVVEKSASNRDNRTLERIVNTKPIQKCGGDSQSVDCSWSQCFKTTTHRRMQTWVSAVAFLVSSTLEQQTASEASRLGKEKGLDGC